MIDTLRYSFSSDVLRVQRVLSALTATVSVVLLSHTGVLPFLDTIFYSYLTWRLDVAILSGQWKKAHTALLRSYLAKGILCFVASGTYLFHMMYHYFSVPTEKRKWTYTLIIELCVSLCIFVYSVVLLYYGLVYTSEHV